MFPKDAKTLVYILMFKFENTKDFFNIITQWIHDFLSLKTFKIKWLAQFRRQFNNTLIGI